MLKSKIKIRADLEPVRNTVLFLIELANHFGGLLSEVATTSVVTTHWDDLSKLAGDNKTRKRLEDSIKSRKEELEAAINPLRNVLIKRLATLHEKLPQIRSLNLTPVVDKYIKEVMSFMEWQEEDAIVVKQSREAIAKGKWGDIIDREKVENLFDMYNTMSTMIRQLKPHINKLQTNLDGHHIKVIDANTKRSDDIAKFNGSCFQNITDLKWKEVTITFLTDLNVSIKARTVSKEYDYSEMGFKDYRTSVTKADKQYDVLWEFLKMLAELGGRLSRSDEAKVGAKVIDSAKKRVSRLNKVLKLFFGIKDNPIYYSKKYRCYACKSSLNYPSANADRQVTRPKEKFIEIDD